MGRSSRSLFDSSEESEAYFEEAYASSFEELKVLGRGSYGTATLVRHRHSNALLVVKKLEVLDGEGLRKAEAEASVLARLGGLGHPCILRHVESFLVGRTFHIVTEYVEDGSLRDLLDRVAKHGEDPRRSPARFLQVFAQIVAALGAMHGASPKVLHRDLKPENVFLSHVSPDDAVAAAAAAASGRGGGRGMVPTILSPPPRPGSKRPRGGGEEEGEEEGHGETDEGGGGGGGGGGGWWVAKLGDFFVR